MRSGARKAGERERSPVTRKNDQPLLIIAVFLLLGLAASSAPAKAADGCLTYGKPVALTGLVSLVWGWGAPGYGEDPKHDHKGQSAVMMLDHHICVTGGDPDGPDADTFNIAQVQLVPRNFQKFKRSLLGKPIVVKGVLFHRVSGGLTDVMIDYESASLLP